MTFQVVASAVKSDIKGIGNLGRLWVVTAISVENLVGITYPSPTSVFEIILTEVCDQ